MKLDANNEYLRRVVHFGGLLDDHFDERMIADKSSMSPQSNACCKYYFSREYPARYAIGRARSTFRVSLYCIRSNVYIIILCSRKLNINIPLIFSKYIDSWDVAFK